MQTARHRECPDDRCIGTLFFRRAEELGGRTFIKLQRGERFEDISWRDFGDQVRGAILGLSSLGINKGERVAIIGQNCLEWLCADMATLAGGFPNVVASPSLSDQMLLKILNHSGCRAAFVADETGARRLLNLKSRLPGLAHIIDMGEKSSSSPLTLNFAGLLSRGSRQPARRLQAILGAIRPDDLATIMYTSGSTGEPKGVMRTQNNLLSNISSGGEIVLSNPQELTVLLLSLNPLFGRFGFLKSAVTGRSTAVIEATELSVNMKIIEALAPTTLALVPRVMEKIWTAILDERNNRADWEELEGLDRAQSNKEN